MPNDPEVHIDEDALLRAAQPQLDAVQERLNEELRTILREVRDSMSRQPAEQVMRS